MSTPFTCPSCDKKFKAPDHLDGKRIHCPACRQPVLVKANDSNKIAHGISADREAKTPQPPPPSKHYEQEDVEPERQRKRAKPRPIVVESLQPNVVVRHAHWVLVLALIPLAISLIFQTRSSERESDNRFQRTIDEAPPDVQSRLKDLGHRTVSSEDEAKKTEEEFFEALPNHKLIGAHLARKSWGHWLYFLVSSALFLGLLLVLSSQGSANPLHLVLMALFTATIGVAFLLLVQWVADWTQSVIITGRGIVMLVFYVLKFIGFSYRAALDPDNGFILSFLGFTLGVGLCEELVKAVPLLMRYREEHDETWRTALLWGLASGMGFGLSEAIHYAGRYYNGIATPGVYFVRFLSCVALHAVWSGSVGMSVYRRRDFLRGGGEWHEYLLPILLMIGVPMVLHGLYDTLLKRGEPLQNSLALLIAILSFGWLAVQISLGGQEDYANERRALLKEYKRRRLAQS